MASVDRLVQTWMASGRDEEVVETVSGTLIICYNMVNRALNFDMADISSDRTSLIKVVQALGEYLTSEEGELRRKGKPYESDHN